MPQYLVVPIDVAALVVAPSSQVPTNTGFLPAMTSFDQLPYGQSAPQPFISEYVLSQPFADLSTAAPPPGVRVHWAMPDALMRGTRPVGPDGKPIPGSAPQFAALPDFWLATRVALLPGQPAAVCSWIIDSRFLASDDPSYAVGNVGSSAVPWNNPNDPTWQQQPYRWLGRTVPLSTWAGTDGADYLPVLNATSFGLIQLAAYYPNVCNVFGFFDSLDGLPTDQAFELCYAVTGWHTRASDDLMAGTSGDEVTKILAQSDWIIRGADPKTADPIIGTPAIARSVYAGIVNAIGWNPSLQPVSPSPLTATIGNTTSESLSALIVNQPGATLGATAEDNDQLEFELHSLLSGQLALLGDVTGPRQVTRQLHQQRFAPIPGGLVWYARRLSDGADISPTLPSEQVKQLADLNQLQAKADRLSNDIAGKQWQVFADWYKYAIASYAPPNQPNLPDSDDVMDFMQGTDGSGPSGGVNTSAPLPDLQTDLAKLKGAKKAATAAKARLTAALDLSDVAGMVKLAQKPGDFFWLPADPTLLLSGPDVVPALRYGGDGTLACRTADTLVSALAAPAGAVGGSPALALNAQDSPGLGATANLDPAILNIAASMVLEAALLWPNWAAATFAAKPGGGGAQALSAWQAWIGSSEPAFLAGSASAATYTGAAPSPVGIDLWSGNPWLPIMMHWQVGYWPAQLISPDADPTDPTQPPKPPQTLDPALILSRLSPADDSLDPDGVDLMLTGEPGPTMVQYRGINFITPHAGYAVWQQLNDYAAANPNSPLGKLAEQVTPMPLLSQTLSGFHERFLLRRRTLQLDVRDPFALGDEMTFIQAIRTVLAANSGRASTTAPMVEDSFCPVRAGFLDLAQLWLVDAFGQVRVFDFSAGNNSLLVSRSLASGNRFAGTGTPGAAASAPAFRPVFAPPRLSQPALLRFLWLDANADTAPTATDPKSSPICGWLVPNYLDDSLMIYDPNGVALGSLADVNGAIGWLGSPANPETFGETPKQVFTGRNKHLAAFVEAMLARPNPQYLSDFLTTLNDASATIQPLQHAQTAQVPVLVGQPLALVRASLTLEFMSGPAINNTWQAFEHDINNPTDGRTTNGHDAVQFPVLLGSVSDPDDGLIGFYLNAAQAPFDTFDTFYSVVAETGQGVATRQPQTVSVSVQGGPVRVTMVVDPRCAVHATTGYMPVQAVQVPPEMFRDAFSRLAVTFLTSPVLNPVPPKNPLSTLHLPAPPMLLPLPLPGQQKGQWSWVSVVGQDHQQTARQQPVKNLQQGQPFSNPSYQLYEGWLSLKGFEE
jgi:hypothetical protein